MTDTAHVVELFLYHRNTDQNGSKCRPSIMLVLYVRVRTSCNQHTSIYMYVYVTQYQHNNGLHLEPFGYHLRLSNITKLHRYKRQSLSLPCNITLNCESGMESSPSLSLSYLFAFLHSLHPPIPTLHPSCHPPLHRRIKCQG